MRDFRRPHHDARRCGRGRVEYFGGHGEHGFERMRGKKAFANVPAGRAEGTVDRHDCDGDAVRRKDGEKLFHEFQLVVVLLRIGRIDESDVDVLGAEIGKDRLVEATSVVDVAFPVAADDHVGDTKRVDGISAPDKS